MPAKETQQILLSKEFMSQQAVEIQYHMAMESSYSFQNLSGDFYMDFLDAAFGVPEDDHLDLNGDYDQHDAGDH